MDRSHIEGGEWIKGNKKFLYYFEILIVVFELEKRKSKPICGEAALHEFVGRPTLEWRQRRCAGREGSASLPNTAWHGNPMCFAASRLHYPKLF